MEKTYYSSTETAALIRLAMKEAFPGVKFSVRKSPGGAVNVNWIDGPTLAQGKAIAGLFTGEDFDGMQDMRVSRMSTFEGKPVSFGAGFIFCGRDESPELIERANLQWSLMTIEAQLRFLNSHEGRYGLDMWQEDTEDKRAERWARQIGVEPQPSPTAAKVTSKSGIY